MTQFGAVLSTAAQSGAVPRGWFRRWLARDRERSGVTGPATAVTVMGHRPSRGDRQPGVPSRWLLRARGLELPCAHARPSLPYMAETRIDVHAGGRLARPGP